MNVSVSIKQINSNFNTKYADEYHGGKESENNQKVHWEESTRVLENVKEIILKSESTYLLKGRFDGQDFSYEIQDMQVLECITDSGEKWIYAISNKLISKTHQAQNKKYNRVHYYFYLKDNEESIKIGRGVVIAKGDFPRNLLN
jgi:hypothetical protein